MTGTDDDPVRRALREIILVAKDFEASQHGAHGNEAKLVTAGRFDLESYGTSVLTIFETYGPNLLKIIEGLDPELSASVSQMFAAVLSAAFIVGSRGVVPEWAKEEFRSIYGHERSAAARAALRQIHAPADAVALTVIAAAFDRAGGKPPRNSVKLLDDVNRALEAAGHPPIKRTKLYDLRKMVKERRGTPPTGSAS